VHQNTHKHQHNKHKHKRHEHHLTPRPTQHGEKKRMTLGRVVVDEKTPRWAAGGIHPPRPWEEQSGYSLRDPSPPSAESSILGCISIPEFFFPSPDPNPTSPSYRSRRTGPHTIPYPREP
jgi:hypothetical protein